MINLDAYEEKLYRRAISHLSHSATTNDLYERGELLKEVTRLIDYIQCETQKRKEKKSWKS